MTIYEKAKQLLRSEYENNFEIVKNSHYHKCYMNEKIRHSWQVAGAGNGILRNEKYFKDKSADFIEIAKTAILLHDIFRFSEIRIMYQENKKIDHGIKGAEFLSKFTEFNNPLILLPVKHHGHMIEDFYKDENYCSIKDDEFKEQIEKIIFAVRDADKIANWQILTKEYTDIRIVWLPYPDDFSESQGVVTDAVWESFINGEVVLHKHLHTNADCVVSVIAWVFDINYKYSIDYSVCLDIFEGFEKILIDMKVSGDKIQAIIHKVNSYINQKFF